MAALHPFAMLPASDYERALGPEGLDLLGPLSAVLGKALRVLRPARLLLLGVATGAGLEQVDPSVTQRVVGLDVNLQHLAVAQQRHRALGHRLELYCLPAEEAPLPLDNGCVDLAWGALFFERADGARVLPRVAGWLAPGGALLAGLLLPGAGAEGEAAARFSGLGEAARALRHVPPEELERLAARAGLGLRRSHRLSFPRGGTLYLGQFAKPR